MKVDTFLESLSVKDFHQAGIWNCFYFKAEINQNYLNVYFKVIKILQALNFTIGKTKLHFAGIFAIWWLQNISWVFNYAISVKIRNKSLIVNQYNQICHRNSNFLIISRDMWNTSIIIIIWLNIRKKRISNSAGL